MIMINTPTTRASGTVWSPDDMRACATWCRAARHRRGGRRVKRHIVFDGRRHESAALYPELPAQRDRVELRQDLPRDRLEGGLRAGPAALMAEFRKVHQFNVFW